MALHRITTTSLLQVHAGGKDDSDAPDPPKLEDFPVYQSGEDDSAMSSEGFDQEGDVYETVVLQQRPKERK